MDDEPITAQSLMEILRLEGYHVAAVHNGQAAVEYVRTHPVDLMIVDLRMPGMGGMEVAQVVHQISPDTEIIFLTAYASTDTAIQALRLRVHDYLVKPALPQDVIKSVQKGLERRAARLSAKEKLIEKEQQGQIMELPGGVQADFNRRLLWRGDLKVSLTVAENRLLQILVESAGRVFAHRELILLVQGYNVAPHEAPELIRPLVSRLRHKIAAFPGLDRCVVSIRGSGYMWDESLFPKP
uniref:Two-component system transcriptional regulator n=1 Tax=uncultured Chloroflexota bacterium TaxID=166587 RepID=H5SFM1_9CHLR|nr:two-component system transcriptional regulator [uncultured Chloroflexota bacterium]BAL57211.1 two-component system transcriptional regulator [uncultured Chloroflexota bacterium]